MKLCIGHKNCHIAEPVDQLQGGKEGIVFERPSENPNFNRICVCKVDAGIVAEPVIFRLIHHLLRSVLVAVPGCPALQLAVCPAAEFQKLVPVLFNEEQKPRNARLLLQDTFAKGAAADMDMQSAGFRFVGTVAELNCLLHHLRPRKILRVTFQRGRMADDLKAVVQTAVVLAVNSLCILVSDGKDFFGVAADFARAVNFEFDAKISGRGSIENRFGAVAVIVDGAAFELIVAAFAVRLPPSTHSSCRRTASP